MIDPINRGVAQRVPLSAIIVRPEFNARQTYRDIDPLRHSIEENGLEQPLVCYFLTSETPVYEDYLIYLQSGFRRKLALDAIAAHLDAPDMLVDVKIKEFTSHDEAMIAALAVDTTGDPLRNYDLANRLDYLQRKYPKKDLARMTGMSPQKARTLLGCMRDLEPKIIAAWSKAPSPEMEIPLARLSAWRKETKADQLRALEAYLSGEDAILDEEGKPARGRRGRRLDGKDGRPSKTMMLEELRRVDIKLEDGGTPTEMARLEGISKGLRYALGEITRVF